MQPFHRWFGWVRIAAMAMLAWSLGAQAVLAQGSGAAQSYEKSYVVPYILVIFACALGLLIVCRSSNRSGEIKRTDDDD
ncbi:MAG TPA: hypothetical protein VG056_11650 [Pirellulales bacterium]|jgi:hypothetical protein|nr:hypothetical protein [Pirellulales bacterium]